jgi:hypothetical protein
MHLQISHLGIVQNLTNVVDQAMNALNPSQGEGVWCIYLHWLRTQGLLALRAQSSL